MMKIRNKTLVAAAIVTAFAAASGGASAALFNPFQVTETSVPGAAPNVQTADKITGNYNEVISFGPGTFTVSLMWQAGQYLNNCNTACTLVPNQLGAVTSNQYGLYALYQSSGTFSTTGGVTTFTDTPGVGSIHVFIDPTSNTTFTAPASGALPWMTASAGDDYNIANGTPLGGTGTLNPNLPTCAAGGGINCGSFGTTTSFALTAQGSQYFTLPIPFYNVSFQSGQLNNFAPTGTVTINGSLDVAFQPISVPEPATLALLGIGLFGAGVIRRSRS
jgi:PEP-CTERM motif-containing protein